MAIHRPSSHVVFGDSAPALMLENIVPEGLNVLAVE